jgi:protein-arginine kinase activator protein McsA
MSQTDNTTNGNLTDELKSGKCPQCGKSFETLEFKDWERRGGKDCFAFRHCTGEKISGMRVMDGCHLHVNKLSQTQLNSLIENLTYEEDAKTAKKRIMQEVEA